MSNEIVRENPRISVNELGKYLIASPSQRKIIVRNQKRPPTYMTAYYQLALNAITRFISSGSNNYDLLIEESDRLMELKATNEQDEARFLSNSEAIEHYLNICDDLPRNIEATIGMPDPPKITIVSVEVSVRPEIILIDRSRNNVGSLKLCFSKNSPYGREAGQYIATILYQYTQEHYSDYGDPNFRLAIAVDVFAEEFYTAPRNYIRRMRDIEAACDEIRLMWPTV